MAKYTDNCNLILPEQNEAYNVDIANTNNSIIDAQLSNKMDKTPGKGLSTNDFTNEYKSKIDNLQKIYKFKGNVDTYSDLNNISANNGDIYNVLEEAKNYAWNGTEWVQLGFVINMSEFAYKEEIPTKNSELENDSNFVDNEALNQLQDSMEEASVPAGGTKGQILEKKSNEDNDVGWVDNTGGVTGDTLPVGTVVDFEGEEVPENWEEVEEVENIITASFTENHVITTTDTSEKVNLNTCVQIGKKLSFADGSIVIGKGISKIKVSANVNFQTVTEGLKYVFIGKNGKTTFRCITHISNRATLSITPVLIEVTEGDVVELYVQGTAGDTLRRGIEFGNITVEAVE